MHSADSLFTCLILTTFFFAPAADNNKSSANYPHLYLIYEASLALVAAANLVILISIIM